MLKLLKGISYPLGAFPRGTYGAFVNSLLPLYIATFTNNTALIGLLVTLSACEGAITPLLIGPLTDRTSAKIGRRKIYILIGTILTSSLLLLFPIAHKLDLLIVLIILTGLSNSITSAPHLAMITQNSKKDARSQMVAFIGIFYLLGQVMLTVLALIFWKQKIDQGLFIILSALFLLPSIPLLLFSHDESRPHESSKKFSLTMWFSFFSDRNRNTYMLSQFLLWFGINSVLPFFTLFVRSYLILPQQKAILFYLVIVLASGVFAYPFALLAKKRNERQVFQLGLLFLLIAGVLGIFARQMPEGMQYLIAFCAGVGNAATTAFSYSIFSKIVPDELIGTAGGIHSFLISGLAPIAAFFSGLLIGIFDYPVMFIILTITTTLSIFLVNRKHSYEY